MNSAFSFWEEPSEVVNYLSSKKEELHFDYDEIMHDTHKRVFTVAKITRADLLKDIKNSLSNAYKDGVGFDEWKKTIKPTLQKKGWFGKTKVINPKTKEEKEIYVGSSRLKTIYDTNMRTAYAKARYNSQMQSLGEYFRYTAVLDNKTRPKHKNLHGLILPKTDPFWDTNYPPNDWRCRCKVQVLSEEEIKARGLIPNNTHLKPVASKDFAYNPGKVDTLDTILQNKMTKAGLSDNLSSFKTARNLYVWQKSLDNMVDNVAKGNIIKDKALQVAQVGELSQAIENKLNTIGVQPQAKSISIYQNTISHILRDTKPSHKEPNASEIKAVVGVFDKAKHCFYDSKNENLIYFYPSLQDDSMVNSAVVNLDYVLKKFKTDNFLATINKVPMRNYRSILSDKKRYIKLK
ncbi:phage Mu protein F-like protein [Campylobacter pinnipediorum subsp. caledonicus]|uniref:Phage Mu protein F-like protein n=1 Tax=Campylobacter pinnipediorum subsp. caledonicus TaxID=1874362 RepID=A0A1S6U845_9BACT|nr:phage minor head protein [Campylobacter pinnipediorum]AQW85471.1 phage Mu protein F-like protein [Campylobacter pinnipediorum subsp. caledonicus]AQW87883.1 phage Mu protein F-like protein [Campylobacter pinnipediorum subsp. caledonicus]